MITGKTKLLGVMGYPIEHSLSPVMHNAALEHLGLDYIYLPLAVRPENLAAAIAGLAAIGLQGFSITIPHKQAIIPLLSGVSEVARAVGAVNTVWYTEAGWQGTNTDVQGFLAPLEAMGRDWQHTIALVLGNGGAARAVVAGCVQLGCQEIWVVGRDRQKLDQFRQSWQSLPLAAPLQVFSWDALPQLLPQTQLLVNTTPVGMAPHTAASPLTSSAMAALPASAIVYDLIYTPSPTQFLSLARERGLMAIDGLEMLVQQGAVALEQWVEQPAPISVMRQALQRQLGLMP